MTRSQPAAVRTTAPIPAMRAMLAAVTLIGGTSCTRGAGPELDAQRREPADARAGGAGGGADGASPRDANADAPGTRPVDAALHDAPPDAMPDVPFGP